METILTTIAYPPVPAPAGPGLSAGQTEHVRSQEALAGVTGLTIQVAASAQAGKAAPHRNQYRRV